MTGPRGDSEFCFPETLNGGLPVEWGGMKQLFDVN